VLIQGKSADEEVDRPEVLNDSLRAEESLQSLRTVEVEREDML
jgi:hypothetical protein